MRRAFAWFAAAVAVAVLVVARPHLADRYALYLGSASEPRSATLYLDPFPDAVSCESRVHLFRANGERAFCSNRRVLAFGTSADATLNADFARVFSGGRDCAIPRRSRRSRT